MTDKQSTVAVSDMIAKLRMAQCSSCSCLTKTNDPAYHKEECLYRVLSEEITLLAASSKQAVDTGEPVAWLDEESGAIVTEKLKHVLCEDGFEIPLYRHAQPASPWPAPREPISQPPGRRIWSALPTGAHTWLNS